MNKNMNIIRQGASALTAAFLLGHTLPVFAAQNGDIRITLEQPADGDQTTGIGVIRGWAAAPSGIDRVELFIDEDPDQGTPNQVLGYGGSRNDVCSGVAAVSSFPDCSPEARPGFATAFNFNLLNSGSHEFTVRAFDNDGDHNDDSVQFSTQNLGEEFIGDESRLSLPAFQIGGARKDNPGSGEQSYDLEFVWSTESQRYVMSQIEERTPLPFILPSAPTNLTATKTGGNVELNWTDPVAQGGPGDETWFVIERKYVNVALSSLNSDGFEVIGVVSNGNTSFTDENVSLTVPLPGVYTYRVLTTLPWTTKASGEVDVNQEATDLLPDPTLPDLPL